VRTIRDLKEEQGQPFKEKAEVPEGKKKEGEKKFDFFHRKAELKKEEQSEKREEKREKAEDRGEKKKEFPREEPRKDDSKREFKPYVPTNLQNPMRNLIKSPNYKPMPPGFNPGSSIGSTSSGFPQSTAGQGSYQFNSSMQVSTTHQQGSFPVNSSMTTSSGKHFPMAPSAPSPTLTGSIPTFIKPGGYPEHRTNQPFFSGSLGGVQNQQQGFLGHNWKKT
jgi:hypothetical protein